MGVAAEIGENLFRTGEGRLGVDDPFDPTQLTEMLLEGDLIGQAGEVAEEAEIAGIERGLEPLQEQPTEEPGEYPDRQEEARPAGDPTHAIERQAATGNDTMDVGVMMEGLSPGVENGEHPDLGTEVTWVGGDRAQRLGEVSEFLCSGFFNFRLQRAESGNRPSK
jgi:hypothetical protein